MKLSILAFCWLTAVTLCFCRTVKRETDAAKNLREYVNRTLQNLHKEKSTIAEGSRELIADFESFIESSSSIFSEFRNETEDLANKFEEKAKFLSEFESFYAKFRQMLKSVTDFVQESKSHVDENVGKISAIAATYEKYLEAVLIDPKQLLKNNSNEPIETLKLKRNDFLLKIYLHIQELNKLIERSISITRKIDKFSDDFRKFSSEIKEPENYLPIVERFEKEFNETANELTPKYKSMIRERM